MLLKRHFRRSLPGLVGLSLAIVAYFDASAIGHLTAAAVIGTAPLTPPGAQEIHVQPTSRASGDPILARNPFDSITGPLDGSDGDRAFEPAVAGGDEEPSTLSGEPSLDDPTCDFGRVVLISETDKPEWSFAAIEESAKNSKLRRIGDPVGSYKLLSLRWDRVWLSDDKQRCQLQLGGPAAKAKTAAKTTRKPKRPRSSRGKRSLPPEMAAKIQRISDTEHIIDRSLVQHFLGAPSSVGGHVRIVPPRGSGSGPRVLGVRDDTLFGQLGFKNRDEILSINGFDARDPQKLLEAYGRLQTADDLKVQVKRAGKPLQLDFRIR